MNDFDELSAREQHEFARPDGCRRSLGCEVGCARRRQVAPRPACVASGQLRPAEASPSASTRTCSSFCFCCGCHVDGQLGARRPLLFAPHSARLSLLRDLADLGSCQSAKLDHREPERNYERVAQSSAGLTVTTCVHSPQWTCEAKHRLVTFEFTQPIARIYHSQQPANCN